MKCFCWCCFCCCCCFFLFFFKILCSVVVTVCFSFAFIVFVSHVLSFLAFLSTLCNLTFCPTLWRNASSLNKRFPLDFCWAKSNVLFFCEGIFQSLKEFVVLLLFSKIFKNELFKPNRKSFKKLKKNVLIFLFTNKYKCV